MFTVEGFKEFCKKIGGIPYSKTVDSESYELCVLPEPRSVNIIRTIKREGENYRDVTMLCVGNSGKMECISHEVRYPRIPMTNRITAAFVAYGNTNGVAVLEANNEFSLSTITNMIGIETKKEKIVAFLEPIDSEPLPRIM